VQRYAGAGHPLRTGKWSSRGANFYSQGGALLSTLELRRPTRRGFERGASEGGHGGTPTTYIKKSRGVRVHPRNPEEEQSGLRDKITLSRNKGCRHREELGAHAEE